MKKAIFFLMLTLTTAAATPAPVPAPVELYYTLTPQTFTSLPRVLAVIDRDPLYPNQSQLIAEGPTLETALKALFPDLVQYASKGYNVQFKTRSGEAVIFNLAHLIGGGGVLAVTDHEAAGGGQMWMPAQYRGHTLRTPQIGYYLVWPNQPEKPSFWGIAEIDLIPAK